jgi:hypothetical protein
MKLYPILIISQQEFHVPTLQDGQNLVKRSHACDKIAQAGPSFPISIKFFKGLRPTAYPLGTPEPSRTLGISLTGSLQPRCPRLALAQNTYVARPSDFFRQVKNMLCKLEYFFWQKKYL